MLPHDTKSPKKALWLCCQVVTADHISGQENCNHGPVVPLTSMQATSTPTDSTLISSGGQSGRELAATSRLSKLHPSFPPITSGNCSFILYCFPAAITTLTFTHNLLSFSLSFWECTHQIPALWGAASLPRDWLWKLRKSGKEEKETTQGRQRIVCLLSSPFCYLHQSTVSLGSFYLRNSRLGSPELLGGSLCQPTTKICDGFLKAEL